MKVQQIPIGQLRPSPLNPRKTFSEEGLRELAGNISQQGLLQPVTVRPTREGGYEIVCGERRYRAMSLIAGGNAGYPVPCIVRDLDDSEAFDAMITENLQRQDVDPIEEAFAFAQLARQGKTIDEIALRFGKSQRFVAERIKLDKLLPELKQKVTGGAMDIGAARHISKLTSDEQRQFLEWADESGITKRDAMRFTDALFMDLDRTEWSKDFTGSCGVTCERCQCNSANAGCLFYEMNGGGGRCTRREKFTRKRGDWRMHIIESNADVLVRRGEKLETGKTVVAMEKKPYCRPETAKEMDSFARQVRDKGYEVVALEDYFSGYSNYEETDPRLQEKLAKNEVCRVIAVTAYWSDYQLSVRYYEWAKDLQSDEAGTKAMKLVKAYKENAEKTRLATSKALRGVLDGLDPDELPATPLNSAESLVLYTMLLQGASFEFRNRHSLVSYTPEGTALAYARNHPEEVNRVARDWMRERLDASVEFDGDLRQCRSIILQEWARNGAELVRAEVQEQYAKRQAKIEEQLTALGYNTDGTKMAF